VRRVAQVSIACLVLGLVVTLYGWRYGFGELPEPIPGFAPPLSHPTPVRSDSQDAWTRWLVTADNSGWIRSGQPPQRMEYFSSIANWAQVGTNALSPDRAYASQLMARPDALRAIEALRVGLVPQMAELTEGGAPVRYALRCAAQVPLWRAALREEAGEGIAALDELLLGWQLRADHWVFLADISYFTSMGPPSDMLLEAWTRAVLALPSINAADASRLLSGLDRTLARMPDRSTFYWLSTSGNRRNARRFYLEDGIPWGSARNELGRACQESFLDIRDSARRLLLWAPPTRSGQPRNGPPVSRFYSPLQSLLFCSQQMLARKSDYERLWAAYDSHVLSALHHKDLVAAEQLASSLRRRSGRLQWLGWWDRPAVWGSLSHLPQPQQRLEDWNRLQLDLECARLVLALRAWRDQHGSWPDTLSSLVPAWLSAVPTNPASGEPLAYQHRGDDFLVLRHPAPQSHDYPEEEDGNVVMASIAPARRLAEWQLSGYVSIVDQVANGLTTLRAGLPSIRSRPGPTNRTSRSPRP